jgi:hypothetical protein
LRLQHFIDSLGNNPTGRILRRNEATPHISAISLKRMESVRRSNVSEIEIILDQATEITALDFAFENQTSKAAVQEGSCLLVRHDCNFGGSYFRERGRSLAILRPERMKNLKERLLEKSRSSGTLAGSLHFST